MGAGLPVVLEVVAGAHPEAPEQGRHVRHNEVLVAIPRHTRVAVRVYREPTDQSDHLGRCRPEGESGDTPAYLSAGRRCCSGGAAASGGGAGSGGARRRPSARGLYHVGHARHDTGIEVQHPGVQSQLQAVVRVAQFVDLAAVCADLHPGLVLDDQQFLTR